jgi:hypothetical protein
MPPPKDESLKEGISPKVSGRLVPYKMDVNAKIKQKVSAR